MMTNRSRSLAVLLLLSLALAPLPASADVCGVYNNTGAMLVEPGQSLPKIVVEVAVPEGAIGVRAWQFASESPERDPKFRLAVRLKINGKLMNHWPTYSVQQSPLMSPGSRFRLEPGDTVTLVFLIANLDTVPRVLKGNAWVYFDMPSSY